MKKKKMNGNTVLLIITIVLFFVMYAVGCAIYANKGIYTPADIFKCTDQ